MNSIDYLLFLNNIIGGIMKKPFLISILTLLFLLTSTVASAQWVLTDLTDNLYTDYAGKPQINSSGHVVWFGYDGTDYEIFYYNGSTVTQLTNNSEGDWYPHINNNNHKDNEKIVPKKIISINLINFR